MNLQLLYEFQLEEINFQKLLRRLSQLKDDDYQKRLKQEYFNLKQQYLELVDNKKKEGNLFQSKKQNINRLEENKKNYEELKYSSEINSAKKLKMVEKQIMDVENNIKQEKKKAQEIAERINKINSEISSVKKKIIFIKNKYENLTKNNESELNLLQKKKDDIEESIKAMKEQIDDHSIKEYLKMKSRFDDPISIIGSRKCGGCSVDIPSMNYESAKAGNIVKCENCGRMLLYKKVK